MCPLMRGTRDCTGAVVGASDYIRHTVCEDAKQKTLQSVICDFFHQCEFVVTLWAHSSYIVILIYPSLSIWLKHSSIFFLVAESPPLSRSPLRCRGVYAVGAAIVPLSLRRWRTQCLLQHLLDPLSRGYGQNKLVISGRKYLYWWSSLWDSRLRRSCGMQAGRSQ